MFSSVRRHLSYANVVATMALVFAMSGGALAASHYLINSTKEINPKVLKKLRGHNGAKGAKGANGLLGKEGPQGKEGAQGKQGAAGLSALATLPSGESESGTFAAGTSALGERRLSGRADLVLRPAGSRYPGEQVHL